MKPLSHSPGLPAQAVSAAGFLVSLELRMTRCVTSTRGRPALLAPDHRRISWVVRAGLRRVPIASSGVCSLPPIFGTAARGSASVSVCGGQWPRHYPQRAPSTAPTPAQSTPQRLTTTAHTSETFVAFELGRVHDPRIVDALIPLLQDPEGWVREAAAYSLGKLNDPRALLPLRQLAKHERKDLQSQESRQGRGESTRERRTPTLTQHPAPPVNVLGGLPIDPAAPQPAHDSVVVISTRESA